LVWLKAHCNASEINDRRCLKYENKNINSDYIRSIIMNAWGRVKMYEISKSTLYIITTIYIKLIFILKFLIYKNSF